MAVFHLAAQWEGPGVSTEILLIIIFIININIINNNICEIFPPVCGSLPAAAEPSLPNY